MDYCIIAIVVLLVIVLAALWGSALSRLNKLGVQVELAGGTLAVQLRQRFDLIPDTMRVAEEAIRDQMKYVREILEVRYAINTNSGAAKSDVSQVPAELRSITSLAEKSGMARTIHEDNPQMDTSARLKLMDQLKSTEENVTAARRMLESAVSEYNTAVGSFPGGIVARLHGYPRLPTTKVTAKLDTKPDYWGNEDLLLRPETPREIVDKTGTWRDDE